MPARSLLQFGMILLLAVGLTMCKQPDEQPADPEAAETPPAAETPTAGEVMSPQAVTEQVREIQLHMKNARRRVRDGNRQEGSLELSEAASVFSQHANASSDAVKEHLEFSASEFSGMAERVFETPAITMGEMDAALTRAFWALAAYHQRLAGERWAAGLTPETAAHLNATATFIDEAVGYLSGGFEIQLENLIAQMRDLARQLAGGATLDGGAVTAQIEDLGRKVERFSKQVRQAVENLQAA